MNGEVGAALKEVAATLVAMLELIPHYGSCQSLPVELADGTKIPSGMRCNCARGRAATHAKALTRMVAPKVPTKRNGGRKS